MIYDKGNDETNVNLYAAYDEYLNTTQDIDKYRDFLSITCDVTNESGTVIGEIVTLYAHIGTESYYS